MTATITSIIQSALQTGTLSASQEDVLNALLFGDACSDADLFLLRRLQRAIAAGSIEQVRYNGLVVAGSFGLRMRLVSMPISNTTQAN